jgi:hypothetical protein
MVLVGDSTALGKAIMAQHYNVSPAGGIPDQAHHLLSSEVITEFETNYSQLAWNSGYQLNGAGNGILLPTHFGHQMKVNLQRHCGYHYKTYMNNIRKLVRPIYNRYKNKDTCSDPAKTNFNNALSGAENTVRSNIVSRAWWLYDWSKPLWDGDYRDEGTGNLYLNRPPDTSYKAGLQWLIDKQGGIKRRYTKQKKGNSYINVVKKKWYNDNTYPAPSSIYK